MARSIGDWFADHGQLLPDDAADDELVEPQPLWDLRSSGASVRRSERRDAGYGGGGSGRRTSGAKSVGAVGRTGATGGRSADASSRRTAIRDAVRAHPGMGKKALAALLRARGIPTTKAEVTAAQLNMRAASPPPTAPRFKSGSKPGTGSRRTTRKPAKKPAMVFKISAGAQTSRTEHETPLCPSCGIRVNLNGGCRCS